MESGTRLGLYRERRFEELITVTFAFFREHFVALLKAFAIFIMPMYLLNTILSSLTFGGYERLMEQAQQANGDFRLFAETFGPFVEIIILSVILSLVAIYAWSLVLLSYFELYVQGKHKNLEIGDWVAAMRPNALPLLLTTIVVGVLCCISIFFCVLPVFYFGTVFSLAGMVVVMEKARIGETLSRCFELIKDNWWYTFLLLLLVGIITGILSLVFSLPSFIIGISLAVSSIDTGSIHFDSTTQILLIITTSIEQIGSSFLGCLGAIAIAFQYGNLVEQTDAVGLNERLSAIDEAENNDEP